MSWIDYRLGSGLPDSNTMNWIVKGRVKAGTVVEVLPSLPYQSRLLGYLPGGLTEVRVAMSVDVIDNFRWFW